MQLNRVPRKLQSLSYYGAKGFLPRIRRKRWNVKESCDMTRTDCAVCCVKDLGREVTVSGWVCQSATWAGRFCRPARPRTTQVVLIPTCRATDSAWRKAKPVGHIGHGHGRVRDEHTTRRSKQGQRALQGKSRSCRGRSPAVPPDEGDRIRGNSADTGISTCEGADDRA